MMAAMDDGAATDDGCYRAVIRMAAIEDGCYGGWLL